MSAEGIERWVRARPDRDGMEIEARLHADEAALVMKAIEPREATGDHGGSGAGDSAGALVQVAESYIAGQRPDARPGGERHQPLCVKADACARA
ncbi:MAG: hypothetical protein U1F43_37655 [Myxococcota bacterium]